MRPRLTPAQKAERAQLRQQEAAERAQQRQQQNPQESLSWSGFDSRFDSSAAVPGDEAVQSSKRGQQETEHQKDLQDQQHHQRPGAAGPGGRRDALS